VRIVLVGQVNAGKSSLVNALAQEIRSAVGPLPTTSQATEYQLEVEGQPTISLVDMPGLDARLEPDLLKQVERADLVLWVASATQTARDLDCNSLQSVRAWSNTQRTRRVPSIVLALTHIDQLSPANEWTPPYDIVAQAGPKARSIRAAVDAVAVAFNMPADTIVPVSMPLNRQPYNIDALWARISVELDEAKLVQLDRLRMGQQRLSLRELADQLGHAGRFIVEGVAKGPRRLPQ